MENMLKQLKPQQQREQEKIMSQGTQKQKKLLKQKMQLKKDVLKQLKPQQHNNIKSKKSVSDMLKSVSEQSVSEQQINNMVNMMTPEQLKIVTQMTIDMKKFMLKQLKKQSVSDDEFEMTDELIEQLMLM